MQVSPLLPTPNAPTPRVSGMGWATPDWAEEALLGAAERLSRDLPLLSLIAVTQLIGLAAFVLLVVRHIQSVRQVSCLRDTIAELSQGSRLARCAAFRGPMAELTREFNDMVTLLSNEIRSLRDTQRELEQLVATDRLTGVGNRRQFEQQADAEVARAHRYGVPTSMILFDVDHFKKINDRFGHQIGDAVLVTLTRRVAHRLRDTDCIARWGGEEFAVLTPCTPISGAENLAEKIRNIVAEEAFDVVGRVTISLGVAQLLPEESATRWIARADESLYEAKRSGRNRVCSKPIVAEQSVPFILVWGEQFVINHTKIDTEHAEIFRLANEIILAADNSPRGSAVRRFDRLLSCIFEHFHSEEMILTELGCPTAELEKHALLHKGLVAQLSDLRTKFLAQEVDVQDVADFVVRRIAVGHLVGADLPLFASLTQSGTMPVRESSSPPLRNRSHRAGAK